MRNALMLAMLLSAARPATAPARPAEAGLPAHPEGDWDRRGFDHWDSFTVRDGLPDDKVFCVKTDGPDVWAGTEKGLAHYHDGVWHTLGVKDGLPHPVVLSIDICARTGDVWIGTMGGLARLSAGRIDSFTQTTSGLSNDFVNNVRCDPDENQVWAATAMGASRLDLTTGTWTVFTETNTPMHEPWTYSVAIDRGLVYVGAWGAGVLEMDKKTGTWREYHDPDDEMEIDVFRDAGPVHDVTSSVDYSAGVLWQATYFGLSRYDGRHWHGYFKEDSGLASNFINFVRARGRVAWLATDDGLSATDGTRWATYRKNAHGGEVVWREGRTIRREALPTIFRNNYILGVDVGDDAIWVATEGGVARGTHAGAGHAGTEPRAH